MKETINRKAVCPKCGQHYTGYPALSRLDNKTHICPDCGVREALNSLSLTSNEQEKIIETLHKYSSQMS